MYKNKSNIIKCGRATISFDPNKTKVKNEFAQETDVNYIMKKYQRTGQLPPCLQFNASKAKYGDFSACSDFGEAMAFVNDAISAFNSLPLQIKAMFGSDPAKFFAFYNDPANVEKCVELGLKDKSELPVKESVQMDVQETASPAPAEASAKSEQLA